MAIVMRLGRSDAKEGSGSHLHSVDGWKIHVNLPTHTGRLRINRILVLRDDGATGRKDFLEFGQLRPTLNQDERITSTSPQSGKQ